MDVLGKIVHGANPTKLAADVCRHPLTVRMNALLAFCALPGVDVAAIAEAIAVWNVACDTLVTSIDVPLHVKILVLAALDTAKQRPDNVVKARSALDYVRARPETRDVTGESLAKRKAADAGLDEDDRNPTKRAKTTASVKSGDADRIVRISGKEHQDVMAASSDEEANAPNSGDKSVNELVRKGFYGSCLKKYEDMSVEAALKSLSGNMQALSGDFSMAHLTFTPNDQKVALDGLVKLDHFEQQVGSVIMLVRGLYLSQFEDVVNNAQRWWQRVITYYLDQGRHQEDPRLKDLLRDVELPSTQGKVWAEDIYKKFEVFLKKEGYDDIPLRLLGYYNDKGTFILGNATIVTFIRATTRLQGTWVTNAIYYYRGVIKVPALAALGPGKAGQLDKLSKEIIEMLAKGDDLASGWTLSDYELFKAFHTVGGMRQVPEEDVIAAFKAQGGREQDVV